MTRTLLLGALGLVLAVATGLGVHLLTRDTIALPVVKLEQDAGLAPTSARRPPRTRSVPPTAQTSSARRTTAAATTARPVTTDVDGGATDTDDNSGPGSDDSGGRGRGRGRGGDDGRDD